VSCKVLRAAYLKVERIINEPTAAALAYGLDKKDSESKILVFDCGGGTHDVSYSKLEMVFLRSTDGDTHLGGDDFDNEIINWMVAEFNSENGIDLSKDPMGLQRLREAAEKALNYHQRHKQILTFLILLQEITSHYTVKQLTRAKFDQMTSGLVERAIKC
jgi:molecular chaperone DnaK